MKPSAFLMEYKDGSTFLCLEDQIKDYEGIDNLLPPKPVWCIDFTRYKVVPLEPTEEILEEYPSMAIPALKGYWKIVIEAAPDIENLK